MKHYLFEVTQPLDKLQTLDAIYYITAATLNFEVTVVFTESGATNILPDSPFAKLWLDLPEHEVTDIITTTKNVILETKKESQTTHFEFKTRF